jgi:hypothetical protein
MKIMILVIGLLVGLSASARDKTPPAIVDGLHLVPDTQLGLVYAEPDADLSVYANLLLLDAQVAFKKNWRRDINQNKPYHVTADEMQKIKADVSALFREIFTRELQSAGFVLVSQLSPDTLIIRPAILDLNVNSPDIPSTRNTRNITESAGDMTLYLELRDSITGDVLVKAMDFQFDRSNITTFMLDRTRNERAARQLLTNWAQVLVNGLQETGVSTSARP